MRLRQSVVLGVSWGRMAGFVEGTVGLMSRSVSLDCPELRSDSLSSTENRGAARLVEGGGALTVVFTTAAVLSRRCDIGGGLLDFLLCATRRLEERHVEDRELCGIIISGEIADGFIVLVASGEEGPVSDEGEEVDVSESETQTSNCRLLRGGGV